MQCEIRFNDEDACYFMELVKDISNVLGCI